MLTPYDPAICQRVNYKDPFVETSNLWMWNDSKSLLAFSNILPTCTEIIWRNSPCGLMLYFYPDAKHFWKKKLKETKRYMWFYWLHKELRSLKMGRRCMKWSFGDSKDTFILGSHEDIAYQWSFKSCDLV